MHYFTFTPLEDQKWFKTYIAKQSKDASYNAFASTNSISEKLIAGKQKVYTERKIPKRARYSSADNLSVVINNCIKSTIKKVFLFSCKLKKWLKNLTNLTSKIKHNILNLILYLQHYQNQDKIILNCYQKNCRKSQQLWHQKSNQTSKKLLALFKASNFLKALH